MSGNFFSSVILIHCNLCNITRFRLMNTITCKSLPVICTNDFKAFRISFNCFKPILPRWIKVPKRREFAQLIQSVKFDQVKSTVPVFSPDKFTFIPDIVIEFSCYPKPKVCVDRYSTSIALDDFKQILANVPLPQKWN